MITPLTILLLEDSIPDAGLIEARLAEGALVFRLERVESRAEFTRALEELGCDIILSDYNVPSFEGTEALAIARAARPDTPFVFVTGALGDERAIELLKLGATDYVLKDKLERLLPSVERALREARAKTERRRAERALEESERALSTLMRNLPGMAFRCVPEPPRVFEYASPGAVELSGYQPEDFYRGGCITWAELMHPDDVNAISKAAEAAFGEKRQLTVTYRIRTRSGQEKWVWDRSVGIYDESGVLRALEGFITDVTEQKRQAEEAQKRAEFEQQLIGIVSHDLRNPLSSMLLGVHLLLLDEEQNATVTKTLLRMQRSGQRAQKMIADLLDFTQARLGGGIPVERKDVSLRQIVQPVIEEAVTLHPERELLVSHQGDGAGAWDPDRLAQVASNLVVNALRYSASGTPVTVRTACDDDVAVLEVHNFGEPITAELRARLFQPMQRGVGKADATTRSVGLGLYIVEQIVRGHGGTVEVESAAPQGTTFRVRLPRHDPLRRASDSEQEGSQS
ncbi:MAG TPA: ATP-binding protein [Polyangiaceae bacterium]|nr:ATP-binding protein [Polyangiaceae bacterium]